MFFHYDNNKWPPITSIIIVGIVVILIGCAADKAMLPSFEGKLRIKINNSQLTIKEITPLINSKTITRNDRETSDDRSANR